MMDFPERFPSEEHLDEFLARPSDSLKEAIRQYAGPLLILGAAGKMGPTLCLLARRAAEAAGQALRIIAVSRFSTPASRAWFEKHQIETWPCDLFDSKSVQTLPDSTNIIYLVGLKFGTQQNPGLTWAANTLIPANV